MQLVLITRDVNTGVRLASYGVRVFARVLA